MNISAGSFKAKCLQLMDEVQMSHEEIIITKYGKPVAKLVAMDQEVTQTLFGYLKNSVKISGNIVAPIAEKWNADE